jgi:hypothetical protein
MNRWNHHYQKDHPLALPYVAESIGSLPKLKDLVLRIMPPATHGPWESPDAAGWCRSTDIPVEHFKNLESLNLEWHNGVIPSHIEEDIKNLFNNSPNLRRFTMKGFETRNRRRRQRIGFPSGNRQLEVLVIHLSDSNWFTSTFRGLIMPTLVVLSILDSPEFDPSETNRMYWPPILGLCIDYRVQLKSLSLRGIEIWTDTLFPYLLSYTGLEKLDLMIVGHEEEPDADAGNIFWNQIVPHHIATLQELKVHSQDAGSWCYGPFAADAIEKCLQLTHLHVTVCEMDQLWISRKLSKGQETTDFDVNAYYSTRPVAQSIVSDSPICAISAILALLKTLILDFNSLYYSKGVQNHYMSYSCMLLLRAFELL